MQESKYSRSQAQFRRPQAVNSLSMKRQLELVAMNPLGSEAGTIGLFEQNSSAEFTRGARRVVQAIAMSATNSVYLNPVPLPVPAVPVAVASPAVPSTASVSTAATPSPTVGPSPTATPMIDASHIRGSNPDSEAIQDALRALILQRAREKSMGSVTASRQSLPRREKSSANEYDLHSSFVLKPAVMKSAVLTQAALQSAASQSRSSQAGQLTPTSLMAAPFLPAPSLSGAPTPEQLSRPARGRASRRTRLGLGIAVAIAVAVGAGGFAANAVNANNLELASAKAARVITEARVTTPDAAQTAEKDKAIAAARGTAHVILGALDGYSSVFAGDVSQVKLDSLETARVALVTASLADDPERVVGLVAQLDTAIAAAAGDMVTISSAFVPTQTAAESTVVDAANAQLGILTAAITAKGDVVGEMKTMAAALRTLSSNNGAQLAAHEAQRQAGLAAVAVATAMATKSVVSALRKSSGPKNYVSVLSSPNSHSPTSRHNSASGKTSQP
ncbi:MAG: hypothetical protein H7248_08695 [Microbacteriaceae bacterium]|nr:hypothetical protein [Microbacteriaceae bacterium]